MLRKLANIVMIAALTAGASAAEENAAQKGSGLASWLKSLQKKMEAVNPKKPLPLSTGVAGVRGAKQGDNAKLYWKGKNIEEPVTEPELAEFKKAVDLVDKGDAAAAARGLESFMHQYPDSALIPDAKKTLDMVKASGN